MYCEQVKDILLDYSQKELKPSLSGKVEEHIFTCMYCRKELKAMEKDLALIKLPEGPSHPDAFWEDFTEGVLRHLPGEELKPVPVYRRILFPVLRIGAAAAMLLLVFKLSFYKLAYTPPSPEPEKETVLYYNPLEVLSDVIEEKPEDVGNLLLAKIDEEVDIEDYPLPEDENLDLWLENLSEKELEELKVKLEKILEGQSNV